MKHILLTWGTLPNVKKIDFAKTQRCFVVSTLPNVIQINVEIDNDDPTFFNVVIPMLP